MGWGGRMEKKKSAYLIGNVIEETMEVKVFINFDKIKDIQNRRCITVEPQKGPCLPKHSNLQELLGELRSSFSLGAVYLLKMSL